MFGAWASFSERREQAGVSPSCSCSCCFGCVGFRLSAQGVGLRLQDVSEGSCKILEGFTVNFAGFREVLEWVE